MIGRLLLLACAVGLGACRTCSTPESQSEYARGFRAGYQAGATEAVQLLKP